MKRKIYDQLLLWKNKRKGKSAMMIEGARRVGKNYIVKEFARKENKSYIPIDLRPGVVVSNSFQRHSGNKVLKSPPLWKSRAASASSSSVSSSMASSKVVG